MGKIQLVIFGVGAFYKNRKEKLSTISNIEISFFLDNNMKLWGTVLDGILIISPKDLNKIKYDYVVLMSSYATEMYEQLVNMEVEQSKILYWGNFVAKFTNNRKIHYACNVQNSRKREQVLIITTDIDYNGGTIAAIYAAICLQDRNYKVDLAAPEGNAVLVQEINEYGIDVIIYESLPYIKKENWINKYKAVIVNVFQMIQCACEIARYRPVLWWIHEPSILYGEILKQFVNYANKKSIQGANIYAVSRIAKENFNTHFSNTIKDILNYGIPDVEILNKTFDKKEGLIFAVIGCICELKAQDIFLQAADGMGIDEPIEFWLIGALGNDVYGRNIMETAKQNPNVKILGVLSRKEIYEKFADIDVVVCPSREDSLPIVMTEAMMFHKICITSDKTGTADYIVDGENGFIVESDNVDMLRDKMQWVIDHRDKLGDIGNKARKTYEKYFSMEIFGDSLEQAIKETVDEWKPEDDKVKI